jgi:hypothetical protein
MVAHPSAAQKNPRALIGACATGAMVAWAGRRRPAPCTLGQACTIDRDCTNSVCA